MNRIFRLRKTQDNTSQQALRINSSSKKLLACNSSSTFSTFTGKFPQYIASSVSLSASPEMDCSSIVGSVFVCVGRLDSRI